VLLDPDRDGVASSRHVHVLPAFGHAIVTDLGSANGTFLEGGVRVLQVALAVGGRVQLGGDGGPWFCLEHAKPERTSPTSVKLKPRPAQEAAGSAETAPVPAPVVGPAEEGGEPISECFDLIVSSGEASARVHVACKAEVHFGSFAGLCDFETVCFPRQLEDEAEALERGDSIGPQHGTVSLSRAGVELSAECRTKLNGTVMLTGERIALDDRFDIDLGDDVLGLRGRVFRHPRLPPTDPCVGMDSKHPVECVVLERKGDGGEDGDGSRLYLQLVRQATIGSAAEAAIHLPFPGVAPLHASIFLRSDCLWITQVSDQPMAVDGRPLQQGVTAPLRLGSVVYLGAAKFSVQAQ
jgi:hypothetical protein